MDISTSTQFALQENISGEWFTRATRYDTATDANDNGEHAFGVDNPSIRVVRIVTVVAPLDVVLPVDECANCGHSRSEHSDGESGVCLVELSQVNEDGFDIGGYADDCCLFERAL